MTIFNKNMKSIGFLLTAITQQYGHHSFMLSYKIQQSLNFVCIVVVLFKLGLPK